MTYDIYKKKKLVMAKLTLAEAAKITGLAEKTIKFYSSTGNVSIDGYAFTPSDVALVKSEDMPEPLKSKWNEIRECAELIRTGKGKIVEENGVRLVKEFAQ